MKIKALKTLLISCLCFAAFVSTSVSANETWRGLKLKEENRCSPYNKKLQYPYPQSVEDAIVASMGGRVYGPYTGKYFKSDRETDIEHIVATSEAHDSGLCAASAEKRKAFATDLLNLTLASPSVNRCSLSGKCGFDSGEWLPQKNRCWFANRVLEIKVKYDLSVDRAEAIALDSVLQHCKSFDMIFFPTKQTHNTVSSSAQTLSLYDDNGNGKITCSEARSHGITPVSSDHPAYVYMFDRDGDGVVCE
ncbi:hypothetical protein TUMSATVNIG1_61220 (plasmid) [Vibrio nigripulchritudo]|uniref:excalibur calcium-binding domain-containing protein n=1 Tax=Vibrio nigripulchritudo TaxID=28173 RepID=UPI00190BCCC5|nr:excalibur calcium-binding domain-containing protein [Vibrio nigripulchritudo]BCL74138.1 hypothetical protein VNTUMSATTG_60750 [Vibrio nigripulchritudo]BDU35513.1 hypothetical protein TUMSATVNIG1_61220 [Vibrio nigripulchritudo]